MKPRLTGVLLFAAALAAAMPIRFSVAAEESADTNQDAELAKKLQNPVAALISLPFKLDYDAGIGPANADRFALVVQPVIPISLNEDWNVISRTIVPFIHAGSPVEGGGSLGGTGDILQSFFFSPMAPTAGGWIWGAGPAVSVPSASKDALGSEKWSVGPTLVVLKQGGGWTYGMLANHLWSIGGNSDRADVSATLLQPFVSYTTNSFTTCGLNTESTYDWKAQQWTVPINLTVSQLLKIGRQPMSFLLGLRGYAQRPSGGPDWGLRFQWTLLFPR
ncbi:MAG: transporter [Mizugakiibacter sp.]|uniref:transporter n=1 Tax=Mizugakiibacter sp. TaxID=1972610 RepID=UPI0031BF9CB1|nr:transporter [Xanthomonadaceae bacterium]